MARRKELSQAQQQALELFDSLRFLREISQMLLEYITHIFPDIKVPDDVHPKVAQAVAYIEANLSWPQLSIQAIADHLGITGIYLCSLYKKQIGQTINQSITDTRIAKAKRLLTTDMRINQVAQKIGYTDSNYFSTVFKKHTGLSPGSYQEQYRNQRDEGAATW
jgi:two-component system response regulator YesN